MKVLGIHVRVKEALRYGNSEFCFPSTLTEVSGKQNLLVPLGPVIKHLIMLVKKVSNLLYCCLVSMRKIYHFFVNRNELVVPDCLRRYLALVVKCRGHDYFPMMNNFAIKIKKVVVIITLSSAPPTAERDDS